MIDDAIRSRRSMLYATFYAKYQDIEEMMAMSTTPGVEAENPFNLDNIGHGYDVWTRGETQLLVLAVILVFLTLIFAAIVALDCGRNGPPIMRRGTLRDIVWHGRSRVAQRALAARSERRANVDNTSGDLKAPPLSYLAPPPYVDRRQETLPV